MPEVLVRVVVFDQGLYHGRGDVNQWVQKITNRFGREARHYAPVRSGDLREGILTETHQIGPREVQGTITSTAPHTLWVLRGTGFPVKGHGGRIYTTKGFANPEGAHVTVWGHRNVDGGFTSKRGKAAKGSVREQFTVRVKGYWLKIPADEKGPGFIAFSVSGQEPNNFLLRAWHATARDHRAIRGVLPDFIAHP